MSVTLVRYWGSNIKSVRAAEKLAATLYLPAAKGWTTWLVCSHPPSDASWLAPLRDARANIEYLPRARGNVDPRCIARTFALCRRVRCDVFHCDNIHTSPLIGAALARVPVRFWFKRSMQPAFEAGRSPTLRDTLALTVRLSAALSTRIVAVSRAVREETLGLGVSPSKVVVLNNAVDVLTVPPEARDAARAALGYSRTDVVILSVGRAERVKGWDLLIKAFAAVSAAHDCARLLLVGSIEVDPHFFDETVSLIMRLRIVDRVRFTGYLTDVSTALEAADIFALPSRSEGNCNALLEAVASGLPCVTTQVGNSTDIVHEGVNGLLVPRNDASRLADSLRLLVQSPDIRRRLAAAAPSALDGTSSTNEYADQLFGLYSSLHATRRINLRGALLRGWRR